MNRGPGPSRKAATSTWGSTAEFAGSGSTHLYSISEIKRVDLGRDPLPPNISIRGARWRMYGVLYKQYPVHAPTLGPTEVSAGAAYNKAHATFSEHYDGEGQNSSGPRTQRR